MWRIEVEEADARLVGGGNRRQKALMEEQQRLDRLRACERIWEKEKRKIREEKKRVMKKREEEARAAEARRMEEEAQRHRMRIQRPQLAKVSYRSTDIDGFPDPFLFRLV